jgi:3-ketosteroid 9alpha-monooxygenase subunit A
MGVHLAQGGRVDGSLVRCPFHGWGFDAAGWCRDIPYAPQLPPRCGRGPVMHGYPVQEAGGAVWAWHHPENKAPSFPLGLEELGAPACEPIRLARNAADAAEVVAARLRRLLAPEASAGVSSVDGFAWTTPDGALTIRAHGPAKITARRQGAVLTALLTPLEAQETELQIALTAGEGGRAALTPALCGPVAQGLAEAEEPADPQFRRWLEQFLVAPTPAQMEAAE